VRRQPCPPFSPASWIRPGPGPAYWSASRAGLGDPLTLMAKPIVFSVAGEFHTTICVLRTPLTPHSGLGTTLLNAPRASSALPFPSKNVPKAGSRPWPVFYFAMVLRPRREGLVFGGPCSGFAGRSGRSPCGTSDFKHILFGGWVDYRSRPASVAWFNMSGAKHRM